MSDRERLVVKCDRGAAYWSESECAVDGFGFVEFESPFFVPRREHFEVGLDASRGSWWRARMVLSSAKSPVVVRLLVGCSDVYRLNKRGAASAPCETPALINDMSDKIEP